MIVVVVCKTVGITSVPSMTVLLVLVWSCTVWSCKVCSRVHCARRVVCEQGRARGRGRGRGHGV